MPHDIFQAKTVTNTNRKGNTEPVSSSSSRVSWFAKAIQRNNAARLSRAALFVVSSQYRLTLPPEQLSDTVGEEGSDTEVDRFFAWLELQDQRVARLDDWPQTGVVDGSC